MRGIDSGGKVMSAKEAMIIFIQKNARIAAMDGCKKTAISSNCTGRSFIKRVPCNILELLVFFQEILLVEQLVACYSSAARLLLLKMIQLRSEYSTIRMIVAVFSNRVL